MRTAGLLPAALALLGAALALASPPANDEEFVGPLAGWINAKADCGAVGDGKADDTAALQKGFDLLRPGDPAKPGPRVLYLPTGTYRITKTLNVLRAAHTESMGITATGDDPATTILKWDGEPGGVMLDWGAWYSRLARLTFDGAGKAGTALRHGTSFATANEIADTVFRDVGFGIEAGHTDAAGIAETPVIRCKFLRCSKAGLSIQNWNSLDWWLWWCEFADCALGVTNTFGAGHFHVYESVFRRSTTADMAIGNTSYFSIRNNFSTGSKSFLMSSNITAAALLTLQGNTIVSATGPQIVYIGNLGPALLFDNVIRSEAAQNGAAPIQNDAPADGQFVSIGNTYTVPDPVKVRGRLIAFDDKIVPAETINPRAPELPTTPPHVQRKVFEIPAGAKAADIQAAVDAAAKLRGQRPVIHLAPGTYNIDRTLIIPPNCGLRLCGDSYIYFTQLLWTGAGDGPMILLRGPTRATLADFHLNGQSKARGLIVEDCDQPGGRIFAEEACLSTNKLNLLVDGAEQAEVRLHDFLHGDSPLSVKVVGGPNQRAGRPGKPVVIFSGGSSNDELTYDVEDGGCLLVRDMWYETNTQPRFVKLSGRGQFALNGATVAVCGKEKEPAIELDDFRGLATFLTTGLVSVDPKVPTGVVVNGEGKATDLLLLGIEPGEHDYLMNTSPSARVVRAASEQMIAGGGAGPLADVGTADPPFLRKMLALVREARPTTLTPVKGGLTDLRLRRFRVDSALVGIELDAAAMAR